MKITTAAVALFALSATVGSAHAASFSFGDDYWGGTPSAGGDTEVIGGARYAISGMTVDVVGANLTVTIDTAYADNIGTGNTFMGSLLLGDTAKLNLAGTSPSHVSDKFVNDTDRFEYAFDFDGDNTAIRAGNGAGSLFKLKGDGSDVQLSSGAIFREGHAIDRTGGDDTGVNGTWQIGAGKVIFSIENFFSVGNFATGLTLAWTMSCANDVIIASIANPGFGPDQGTDVPLPAGIVLLASGLAGMGVISRKKKLKKS
jgi:hypothetical protein